jgi:hypothetical protein
MRFLALLTLTFSGVLITLLNAVERFTPLISLIGSLLALAGGWYAFRLKRLEYLNAKRRDRPPWVT